jgi:hypothetical protein
MGDQATLSTETDSEFHCEGEVVTCARCGRPLTECRGDCEPVIETRGHRILTESDLGASS